jgi:AcrR family transcriptional regulator
VSRHEWQRADGVALGALVDEAGSARPSTRRSRGFTSEERWEQILQVAGRLFSHRGYLGTSLEDIAVRIGIQKASLYHYISSKEDLLYVLERRAHELGSSVIQILESGDAAGPGRMSAEDQLAEFIFLWIDLVSARPENYGSLGTHVLSYLSPARRNELLALRDETQAWLMAVLQRGMYACLFEPTLDPSIVANTLLTLLHNSAWLYRSTRDWGEIASQCATLFFRGVTSDTA